MNEHAPGPAVAVDERMDRLELGVRDRGLNYRWQVVLVAELAEVLA